jgi:hypothetical protein
MTFVQRILAVATLALVPSAAIAQSFDGATLNYQYYFPNSGTPYSAADNGSFVVGPGIEVTNVSDDRATLDVAGSNIFIDFVDSSNWGPATFNGWVLSDQTDSLSAILGVSIDPTTNLGGFSLSNISFTGDSIIVNWQGLSFTDSTVVSLNVAFGEAAVPEPSTWAMMLLGFGAAGFALRRGRKPKLATA